MQTKHILIFCGWLASVAALMTTLDGWHRLTEIQVVGSILGSLAAQVLGQYVDGAPPKGKHDA